MTAIPTEDLFPDDVRDIREMFEQLYWQNERANEVFQALVDNRRDADGIMPGDPREEDYFDAYGQLVGFFRL